MGDTEYGSVNPVDVPEKSGRKASLMLIVWYIAAFIVTGTAGLIVSKVMMQTKADGLPGRPSHYFAKPWYINWLMFVGMFLCVFQDMIEKWFERRKRMKMLRENNIQNNGAAISGEHKTSTWKVFWLVCIPGLCDLVATFLMNVGQLWTLLSVWQMVRGSIVVFTAAIRLVWLKKKVFSFEWVGMSVVVTALLVVGYAGVEGAGEDPDTLEGHATVLEKILGIIFVILAQAIQALQTVIEEYLLHDVDASVNIIVGLEGFWGVVFCTGVAMPIAYFLPGAPGKGIHEDSLDTIAMLENSSLLLWLSIIYAVAIVLFNIYGMHITNVTHSVTRNILEAVRTFFVWVTGLALHYTIGKAYGEAWTVWSYLELVGFGVLIFGLFVFYKVVRLDRKPFPTFFAKYFVYPAHSDSDSESDIDEAEDVSGKTHGQSRPLLESTGD